MMAFLTKFVSVALTLMVLVVAGVFVASMMPIPGNIELKVVKSGSMEPAIKTGALVLIKPQAIYGVGDIITFGEDTKTAVPTTHRVVAMQGEGSAATFTTKGDANEEADPQPVAYREVIGRVLIDVPYAGFVLDFARKPLGFALLIGLPALIIMLDELMTIIGEVRRLRRKSAPTEMVWGHPRREGPRTFSEVQTSRRSDALMQTSTRTSVLQDIRVVQAQRRAHDGVFPKASRGAFMSVAVLGLSFGMVVGHVGGTVSYFSDIERSVANMLMAGVWGPPPQFQAFSIVEGEGAAPELPETPEPPAGDPTQPVDPALPTDDPAPTEPPPEDPITPTDGFEPLVIEPTEPTEPTEPVDEPTEEPEPSSDTPPETPQE